jgi:hypothetical protein
VGRDQQRAEEQERAQTGVCDESSAAT